MYWLLFNVAKYLMPINLLVLACRGLIIVTSAGNSSWCSESCKWSVFFSVSDMINFFHLICCCLVDWFVSRNNISLLQQLCSLASASLKFHCCTVFMKVKQSKGSFKKNPTNNPTKKPPPNKQKSDTTPKSHPFDFIWWEHFLAMAHIMGWVIIYLHCILIYVTRTLEYWGHLGCNLLWLCDWFCFLILAGIGFCNVIKESVSES